MDTFSTGNLLLDRLPAAQYGDLLRQMNPQKLDSGRLIYEARKPIEYAWFPTSGAFSSVAVMMNGDMIEVATIGKEGAMGLPAFVEAQTSPNRMFCQVPGAALKIEAHALMKAAQADGPLRNTLFKYQAAFSFQVSQSVACNGRHVLTERCCRWLLMTHDRVEDDRLHLTHEFLSQMLGANRATVSLTAGVFQQAGLIRYSRGTVTVLDRGGLETAACECYGVMKAEFDRPPLGVDLPQPAPNPSHKLAT